ncbi:hypothetical protein HYH03_013646 [Edaphochlamys debaryana]|uniref:PPIase cyclophilin-type domain-containing protein n=1 Tax=Edaphochlamys debaryana TaxID=47281 RepID=A0A835XMW6_9CHLO|nr:hypothetical protein HYH03_013646 [Edaphochlamys debaryana]|eukprot:KAG2487802.1 hypothetical protein HYH03_013646 [Edaphochlamys debaryana]
MRATSRSFRLSWPTLILLAGLLATIAFLVYSSRTASERHLHRRLAENLRAAQTIDSRDDADTDTVTDIVLPSASSQAPVSPPSPELRSDDPPAELPAEPSASPSQHISRPPRQPPSPPPKAADSLAEGEGRSEESPAAAASRLLVEAEAGPERTEALYLDPDLPLVFFDVAINGSKAGRIEMVLFPREAPRATENFLLLCSGELGHNAKGELRHFKGIYFYRIITDFIDQTGAEADGAFDGWFHCDPEGLKLQHTHKGILSMAHTGPNTNGGHFSIMLGPAMHLNGVHEIFGEIVRGMEVAEAVNALSKAAYELLDSKAAQIVDSGVLRRGTLVDSPEYKNVIAVEKRRIAWRQAQPWEEVERLSRLRSDEDLPLVYLDVAIKGLYAGRMEFVLFVRDSPLAAENFRLLCSGEKGVVPRGHRGEGQPYHFKGAYFYRIVHNFIDQGGRKIESPLGGKFMDDVGGLKLNHTHLGLLSMANHGPNTNSGSFSIMMKASPHLNGHYPVFGELVDGHDVALEINALTRDMEDAECLDCELVKIIDAGVLRDGKARELTEVQRTVREEVERIRRAKTPQH